VVLHSTHLRDRWPIMDGERVEWVSVEPGLICDDVEALIGLAVAGVGVTMLPDFMVQPEVERGELAPLTTLEQATPSEVFVVTTAQRRTERVEALVKHLTSWPYPSG